MQENILSIVTPAYNRAHLLRRCYESLAVQTDDRFEWILVDDGSADDTREVMAQFISSGNMRIQYVYKENGGKHTALNASHPYLHGKYVLILDSDDYLTPDAVERVMNGWNEFRDDPSIGTVYYLKSDSSGNALAYGVNENTPGDYRVMKRVSVISSDFCETFRADLFIRFPYSVFEGERFISESELWNCLAEAGYRCLYHNQIICICEYREDGLTSAGRRMRIRNPLGGMCTSEHFLNSIYPLRMRVKKALLYDCYGFFAGLSAWKILTRSSSYRGIKAICLLPGYVMYRLWKRWYSS